MDKDDKIALIIIFILMSLFVAVLVLCAINSPPPKPWIPDNESIWVPTVPISP